MSKKRFGRKKAPSKPPRIRELETKKKPRRVLDHSRRRPNYNKKASESKRIKEPDPTLEELIAEDVLPPLMVDDQNDQRASKGETTLFSNKNEIKGDLRLLQRAKKWDVKNRHKIRDRLFNIVMKEKAEVVTKIGVMELESEADKISINAAKVLVAMDSMDREVDKKNDKNGPASPSVVIQNNVNAIDSDVEQRRISLARLANRLGARTVSIDGQEVSVADILGTVDEVPGTEAETESEHSSPSD